MNEPLKCSYRPEHGQWPAQDCWTVFLTEEALQAHIKQFHPSQRAWDQSAGQGAPVITLGFTREELDAIEERAWPSSIETWIHEQVTAALGAP